jgi:hypothetical protein
VLLETQVEHWCGGAVLFNFYTTWNLLLPALTPSWFDAILSCAVVGAFIT